MEKKITIRREVIIPAKMSGTGTIRDIESEMGETVLRFVGGRGYAVLLPAFYNARPAYAKSAETAIAKARVLSRKGYEGVRVIDADGVEYEACASWFLGDRLEKTGREYESRQIA